MATAERSIMRGDGVAFPKSNRVINSTQIDILDTKGFRIGFIVELTENGTRRVDRVRELSSATAGRVVEQQPGVEDVNLTIAGYSLYDISQTDRGSLIHRLGSAMSAARSLMGQREPFHIVRVQVHPGTGQRDVVRYMECWLTSYSETRNINTTIQIDRAAAQCSQKV